MSTDKDFHIKGLDCLRFGVENLQDALRFFPWAKVLKASFNIQKTAI